MLINKKKNMEKMVANILQPPNPIVSSENKSEENKCKQGWNFASKTGRTATEQFNEVPGPGSYNTKVYESSSFCIYQDAFGSL